MIIFRLRHVSRPEDLLASVAAAGVFEYFYPKMLNPEKRLLLYLPKITDTQVLWRLQA